MGSRAEWNPWGCARSLKWTCQAHEGRHLGRFPAEMSPAEWQPDAPRSCRNITLSGDWFKACLFASLLYDLVSYLTSLHLSFLVWLGQRLHEIICVKGSVGAWHTVGVWLSQSSCCLFPLWEGKDGWLASPGTPVTIIGAFLRGTHGPWAIYKTQEFKNKVATKLFVVGSQRTEVSWKRKPRCRSWNLSFLTLSSCCFFLFCLSYWTTYVKSHNNTQKNWEQVFKQNL